MRGNRSRQRLGRRITDGHRSECGPDDKDHLDGVVELCVPSSTVRNADWGADIVYQNGVPPGRSSRSAIRSWSDSASGCAASSGIASTATGVST